MSYTLITSFFVLSASCYLLYMISDTLEETGGNIGKLLKLPESVVSSTFQALATSGPEISIAIISATSFIKTSSIGLELGEKACTGLLNMSFSAMDNLIGIGCLGIIFMIHKGYISRESKIEIGKVTKIGLIFYTISSTLMCLYIGDGYLTVYESAVLALIGLLYIVVIFSTSKNPTNVSEKKTVTEWSFDITKNGFVYAFLIFALIIFVKECLKSTFAISSLGIVSVGGVLLALTSYVSSFPEFMLTFRYAIKNKKNEMLGMLFGSNVIDLAFAGFRPLWLGEPMKVYTTGRAPYLLLGYLWCIPVISYLILWGIYRKGGVKYKAVYPMLVFYVIYIISGLYLL